MAVDFDLFYDWSKEYFGEENIKLKNTSHGVEICTNSIWSEAKIGKVDVKNHLWMNPSGGKSKNPEIGSYRCWLTDQKGSLVGLVSNLEHISWDEAETLICGTASLRMLEQKVHEFFGSKEDLEIQIQPISIVENKLELPYSSYLIDSNSTHFLKIKAKEYLEKRKIPTTGFYFCVAGDYKNRIIIPYYDGQDNLIFFNARLISEKKDVLRYLKAKNVNQEEVLYVPKWPKKGSKIYVMEGEFDAKSLELCGLFSAACGGKYLTDTQIELIRDYNPVLSFDADGAGLRSTIDVGNTLLEKGFTNIRYIRPPKAYKDWNKLLVQRNEQVIIDYINRFEKPFTIDTESILLSNHI